MQPRVRDRSRRRARRLDAVIAPVALPPRGPARAQRSTGGLVLAQRSMQAPRMTRPQKLEQPAIDTWIAKHVAWENVHGNTLAKKFEFPDFATALAFVVRIGGAAEKHNHHPDIELGWGRALVKWSTHDAGGVTELDLKLAELSDSYAK